jgi:outer membrane protein TolC
MLKRTEKVFAAPPAILLILLLALHPGTLKAMSLDEAVAYALHHASAVRQSENDALLSEINRRQSQIRQFGELNLVGDFNHYNSARTLAPLTPSVMQSGVPIPETENLYSIGIAYSVPLFTGFAQMRQVEIGTLAEAMARAKVRLTKEELAYNVRSLYLSILAQRELLGAQEEYLRALRSLERTIARDVEAGKKAPLDQIKTRAEVENARTQLETIRANIEITRATLAALIGTDPGRLRPVTIRPRAPRNDLKLLSRQIPQLRKMKLEDLALKKSEKMIAKSAAAKLPQISLSAYAGRNYGEDSAHGLGWEHENIWQVGLHASWNLFDFGRRDLEVQKARIAQMQARIKREQTRRDLHKLLTRGVARIREAWARYRGDRAQWRLSKKSEAIEQVRYDNGAATINDLLLARGRTRLARAKMIESKYTYQKSIYYLDYLLERGVRK